MCVSSVGVFSWLSQPWKEPTSLLLLGVRGAVKGTSLTATVPGTKQGKGLKTALRLASG